MNEGLVLGVDMEKNTIKTSVAAASHIPTSISDGNQCSILTTGGSWWDARTTFGLLTFLGLTVTYMVRVCLSIAIVAIVKKDGIDNTTDESKTCPIPDVDPDDSVIEGEYDWNDQTQATLLGAFFYGYTATNFIGGRAAEYFGGKLTFGLGVVVPSILTLLSPLCIYTSANLFIVLRVLEGMAQGLTFPSMHLLLATWIPPKDKAKYWSIIGSGMQVGTVLAMSVGGWLCSTTFLGGWPSVFYIFGGLGVIWGIPWFLLAHNLPEQHPRISASELQYILAHRYYVKRDKAMAVPWRDIATSRPFWAIIAASFCYNYSFYTLLTELPSYFNKIMHFDMNKNGLSSALPYIVQAVTGVVWGIFVDVLHRKQILSVKGVRKLSTSVALYCSAACLISMVWVNCDPVLAMVVMCLAVGFVGPINSGSPLSEQDIAPNLAGTLKGITNTLGSATGFLAPAITGVITEDNQTMTAWNTVFLIAAVFNVFFCTIYLIFMTDKVQPWNNPKPKKESVSVIPQLSLGKHEEEVHGASQQLHE